MDKLTNENKIKNYGKKNGTIKLTKVIVRLFEKIE